MVEGSLGENDGFVVTGMQGFDQTVSAKSHLPTINAEIRCSD